jgi:hypothetical protein
MKHHARLAIVLAISLLGGGAIVWAQNQAPSSPPAAQPSDQQQLLSADQLDDLIAPIALYPDPLLSQMLVASTYPLEVVEANQWLQQHKNLTDQALIDAAKQQSWDSSVQALVTVPDALTRLSEDISWTTDLGNVFLAQKDDVMDAVQRMRTRAEDSGRLSSTPQQTVTNENQDGRRVVVIEPASPEVIYVPVYDPFYVWGPPVFGFYPSLFYPAFGFGFGPAYDISFCFGGWTGWGGWGWGFNWFGPTVFVNNVFFHRYGFHDRFGGGAWARTTWVHDPTHRLGIPYRNTRIARQFGAASLSSRYSNRGSTVNRNGATPYSNRFAGGSAQQLYRNPSRQQYRSLPQTRSMRIEPSQRYQAPRQNRSVPSISSGRSFSGGIRDYGGVRSNGGARSFGAGRSFAGGGGFRSGGGRR